MKRKSSIVVALMVLLFAGTSFSQTEGFVHTRGRHFVDGRGNVLNLKGINLGNWLNPEGYMFDFGDTVNSYWMINDVIRELIGPYKAVEFWKKFRDNYVTRKDIAFIRKLGFNSVRVPFNYRLFMSSNRIEFKQEGFERLDSLISWCSEEGIYVVLDLHSAPGGQTGDNIDDSYGYPFLFTSPEAQQATVALWKRIAERYKDDRYVLGYDLRNEPIARFFSDYQELSTKLDPLYRRIVSAIRQVDKNHIVILEGSEWSKDMAMLGKPFDPNMVYEFHKYWMPTVQSEIQQYVSIGAQFDIPIWSGESGENTDAWVTAYRKLLDKNDISWCFWTYKKMNSPRGVVSFDRPAGWDKIIEFAQANRNTYAAIRGSRPSTAVIREALDGLLRNVLLKNCTVNPGFVKALGMKYENGSLRQ